MSYISTLGRSGGSVFLDKTPQRLIIIGEGAFAEICYEYLKDTYDIVAFSSEREHIKHKKFHAKQVIPFEDLEEYYKPNEVKLITAVTYNPKYTSGVRTRLYRNAKKRGYEFITYVHPLSIVHPTAEIGENCFIFELNNIQPFAKIGNNCVLWSGNHIGHHSKIRDNCFVSSHCVISGFVVIGKNCFLGVNCTIVNNVRIAMLSLVGARALIYNNIERAGVIKG